MGEQPRCQICGDDIKEDDCVYCSCCHTPHHNDCWQYVGHCSVFACGSLTNSSSRPTTPVLTAEVDLLNIDDDGRCPEHEALVLHITAKPHTVITDLHGTSQTTEANHIRLDLDTPLETFLQIFSAAIFCFSLLIVIIPGGPPALSVFKVLWPIAALTMAFRLFVECTYVLDGYRREILYSRSIVGYTQTWRVCSFDDIECIGLSGRERLTDMNEWKYSVVLLLPRCVLVQISDETTNYKLASGYCRQLAQHLDLEARIPGEKHSGLRRGLENVPMESSYVNWRTRPFIGRATFPWAMFFVFLATLTWFIFLF